jgi:hypothetical protein
MQHIAVLRETEDGERLASFDADGLDPRVLSYASQSGLLRFIDPYGDLLINQLQLPVLISELREVLGLITDAQLRSYVERLIAFLEASCRHALVCSIRR